MKFTGMRIVNGGNIDFPIIGALPSDTYILKSVDGLGPPDNDVSIAMTVDQGGVFQGRRPQNREIVMRVGLNPNYAINQNASDLRETLYALLSPVSPTESVTVAIMNGATVLMQTPGYPKRIEIVPFSKDPEVQITIPCDTPYFSAQIPTILSGATFPSAKTNFTIDNPGSAPTGFQMEVTFTASLSTWQLNTYPSPTRKMLFEYPVISGDRIQFDTRPGSRFIRHIRGSTTTNIICSLSGDSVWMQLFRGINTLGTSSQAFNWGPGPILFVPRYWGV
jgi:hypothetical protein